MKTNIKPIIEIDKISKTYGQGESAVNAIKNISLAIAPASFNVIVGKSGSGKSTLLNLIGLLDTPDKGTYTLDGVSIDKSIPDQELAHIRREKIGFIFQQFNLIQRESALKNVTLPAIYSRIKNRDQKAIELLNKLGLKNRINHKPNQLSGGEQQRVAIARALINSPKIILADEPTGNLDTKTSEDIIKLLSDLNQEGVTIIVVTHDPESFNKCASQVFTMKDGKII